MRVQLHHSSKVVQVEKPTGQLTGKRTDEAADAIKSRISNTTELTTPAQSIDVTQMQLNVFPSGIYQLCRGWRTSQNAIANHRYEPSLFIKQSILGSLTCCICSFLVSSLHVFCSKLR
jgi:hypothetical protein